MAISRLLRRPWAAMRARSASQSSSAGGVTPPLARVPQVELQVALGGAGALEGLVRAVDLGEFGGRPQRMEVDVGADRAAQLLGVGRVEGEALLEEDVLQTHQAEADRAPLVVGELGFGRRVVVDVDHPVEQRHDLTHDLAELGVVELAVRIDVGAEVERTEVAHRGVVLVGDLEDLGAQVRQVHDAGRAVVVGGAGLVALLVRGVLERDPAVAGLSERAHHLRVELAGRDLLLVEAGLFGGDVGALEVVTEQVGEVRDLLGIEQAPLPVLLDALHEQVGDPVGDVEVVRAAGVVAGVVAQLEEVLDVGVPRLEVHAGRALAAAALVDRSDRRVERAQPRHDAVRQAVGALDQAALGAHPVPGDADAAGELRQLGDVGVALVDAFEAVLGRVEQVAARHLAVRGARVEQRGARRQVGERRHQVVEADRLVDVGAQTAGDTQEEVLRGLDDLATRRVAQQVAVVHRAQPEELEAAVTVGVDRGVERRSVGVDEREHVVGHEAFGVADGDRLGEPRDVLVADLFVDDRGEQARGELGVVRLLDDEAGSGADRQVVEFAGGGTVGERRDRAGGDAHRIDAEQAFDRLGRSR